VQLNAGFCCAAWGINPMLVVPYGRYCVSPDGLRRNRERFRKAMASHYSPIPLKQQFHPGCKINSKELKFLLQTP
jgi:hypothetical protein